MHPDAAKLGSHMRVCRVVQIPMRTEPTQDKRTSMAHRNAAYVAILPHGPTCRTLTADRGVVGAMSLARSAMADIQEACMRANHPEVSAIGSAR